MSNLSYKQKQELIDTKLLNIDQLEDYAKKVFETMGNFDIVFPVLVVVEKIERDDLPVGLGFKRLVRRAIWKQCICKGSVYVDQLPVIEIATISTGENILGFITMDTPWEDIKSIFEDLEVYGPYN